MRWKYFFHNLILRIIALWIKEEKVQMSGQSLEEAVFAGGCFWCMEPIFDGLEGVVSVSSGYTGGTFRNPSYEEVCRGNTGHLEAIKIIYDPAKMTYAQLLDIFWHNIDPLDAYGQFCDKGEQYKSAIFYVNEQQKTQAKASKDEIAQVLKGQAIYTQIRPLEIFYPAEDYHQGFHQKNPVQYKSYRSCCRRDERLKELWSRG
jgi:peptide-methionine (S)-S-oxide reductase